MKSPERQAALPDHETREVPLRQQARTVNAVRAHPGGVGIVVPGHVDRLLAAAEQVPEAALMLLGDKLRESRVRIAAVTKRIETADAGMRSHAAS